MPKEYKAALTKDAKAFSNRGGSLLLELAIHNQNSKNKNKYDEEKR